MNVNLITCSYHYYCLYIYRILEIKNRVLNFSLLFVIILMSFFSELKIEYFYRYLYKLRGAPIIFLNMKISQEIAMILALTTLLYMSNLFNILLLPSGSYILVILFHLLFHQPSVVKVVSQLNGKRRGNWQK